MTRIAAILGVLAALAGAAAVASWRLGAWDSDDVRRAGDRVAGRIAELRGPGPDLDIAEADNACEELAARADAIATDAESAVVAIRRLGREAAGIRHGTRGLLDLAAGGRNLIPGRGFRRRYDDGTPGQVRHFAGIAVAASYGGERATRLISIYARRDALNSPDGRLTERGIEFTRKLLSGRLAPEDAGSWIQSRLCA